MIIFFMWMRLGASFFNLNYLGEKVKMIDIIQKDETLEDLQLEGLKLLQKKTGFRFGMDSVLLAHFAAIRPEDHVVDFGTGTGVLPLLLIGRKKGKVFDAIEIQKEYCTMAERTMKMNGLEDRVRIHCADAGEADNLLQQNQTDYVICNPPYGKPGSSISSPFADRSTARNQKEDTLKRFFIAAFRILKGKGKLSIVYPAPQMLYIMDLMTTCHLEPKRFQLVYPQESKPANLVLIEAVKDAKPTLQPMPPLIIYDENFHLTNGLKSVYHIKEQNPVQ